MIRKKNDTIIIELFGLPNTGKTTIIKSIETRLRKDGFYVKRLKERASISPMKDKLHPLFNYWTLTSLLKRYLEVNDKNVDILLADRGIVDAIIWVQYLAERGGYQAFLDDFNKLSSLELLVKNFIKGYFLCADIETVLKRELEEDEDFTGGRILNYVTLKGYLDKYYQSKRSLHQKFNILEIDTSRIDIMETSNLIYSDLKKELNCKFP